MDKVTFRQKGREACLMQMYASVRRQTQCLLDGDAEGAKLEVHQQKRLRARFERFTEKSE